MQARNKGLCHIVGVERRLPSGVPIVRVLRGVCWLQKTQMLVFSDLRIPNISSYESSEHALGVRARARSLARAPRF
jgi:hypothetical protein